MSITSTTTDIAALIPYITFTGITKINESNNIKIFLIYLSSIILSSLSKYQSSNLCVNITTFPLIDIIASGINIGNEMNSIMFAKKLLNSCFIISVIYFLYILI